MYSKEIIIKKNFYPKYAIKNTIKQKDDFLDENGKYRTTVI